MPRSGMIGRDVTAWFSFAFTGAFHYTWPDETGRDELEEHD